MIENFYDGIKNTLKSLLCHIGIHLWDQRIEKGGMFQPFMRYEICEGCGHREVLDIIN